MVKCLALLIGFLCCHILQTHAQEVYSHAVVLHPYGHNEPSIGTGSQDLDAAHSVGWYILLSIDNNLLLKQTLSSLGGYHSWRAVDQGTVLDPDHFQLFQSTGGLQYQMTLNEPFIVGIMITMGAFPHQSASEFTSNDRFGWARLKYTAADGLTLVDSAIANNGLGIIAGTTTVVPEPSTICLSLSAVISLILFRRRRVRSLG